MTNYLSLLLFIMLFSRSVLASYDGVLNPTGCTFDDMQGFYMSELGIDYNTSINLVRKRIADPRKKGFTKPLAAGGYLVAIEESLEPSEIRVTLAHELVHVRQLERGEIKQSEFKKHYLNRSFEDEAFRLSLPLAVKFYTEYKCDNSKENPAQ